MVLYIDEDRQWLLTSHLGVTVSLVGLKWLGEHEFVSICTLKREITHIILLRIHWWRLCMDDTDDFHLINFHQIHVFFFFLMGISKKQGTELILPRSYRSCRGEPSIHLLFIHLPFIYSYFIHHPPLYHLSTIAIIP